MPGAVLIVIAMVLVIPVAIMVGGALWSAIVGWTFDRPEGGEAEGTPSE